VAIVGNLRVWEHFEALNRFYNSSPDAGVEGDAITAPPQQAPLGVKQRPRHPAGDAHSGWFAMAFTSAARDISGRLTPMLLRVRVAGKSHLFVAYILILSLT